MSEGLQVREIQRGDRSAWERLWEGYNAFYGRSGETRLAADITATTWERFFDPAEPVFALVAEREDRLLGLSHYLFHRSTTSVAPVCYLQDLFTEPAERNRGIGRALIEAVYRAATAAGVREVYWQTHASNGPGRRLYDTLAEHLGFIVYDREL